MIGIFPTYQGQEKTNVLPIPRDIAINFATGEPIIENNDFVLTQEQRDNAYCEYKKYREQ